MGDFDQTIRRWLGHIGWAFLLWLPIAVVCALAYWLLDKALPSGALSFAKRCVELASTPRGVLDRYLKRIADARLDIVAKQSPRLLLERRHLGLPRKLNALSERVNLALRSVGLLSDHDKAVTDTKTLLGSFKSDVDGLSRLQQIPANIVDTTIQRRHALFFAWPLTLLGIVMSAINWGLLYLYWDSWDIGPFAYVAALAFPIVEVALGLVLKALNAVKNRGLGTLAGVGLCLLLIAGFAAWEFQIFLTFFDENLRGNDIAVRYPWLLQYMPLVGVALCLACSLIGYMAGHWWLEAITTGVPMNISRHVDRANKMIANLPDRMSAIARDTNKASTSIETLAGAIGKRGGAETEVGVALEAQRVAFIDAINGVDPRAWPRSVDGDDEDLNDISHWAWLAAPVVAAAGVAHVLIFGEMVRKTGMPGPDWLCEVIAVASAAVSVICGALCFDRLELASIGGKQGQVVLNPRDPVMRWAAIGLICLMALVMLGVAIWAYSYAGVLVGAVLMLLILVFVVAGNFLQFVGRGLSFLALCVVHTLVAIGEALWWGARAMVLLLAGLLVMVVKLALLIGGLPLLAPWSIVKAMREARAKQLASPAPAPDPQAAA